MPGEGGQGLFDRLFVTNIGEDVFKDGDLRTGIDGDMQAGLGHESEQADGFQADGFAARIGAGDDEGVGVCVEEHINGDNGIGVEEGVARAFEADDTAGVVYGWTRTLRLRKASAQGAIIGCYQGRALIGVRCPRGVPGASARGDGAQQGERMQSGFGPREVFSIFPLRKRQIKIGHGFDEPG